MDNESSFNEILQIAGETIKQASRQLTLQEIVNKLNLVLALIQLDEAGNRVRDNDVKKIITAMKKELIMYLKSMLNIE